jgi:hypothetical protein
MDDERVDKMAACWVVQSDFQKALMRGCPSVAM